MKTLYLLLFSMLLLPAISACGQNTSEVQQDGIKAESAEIVEVYYFHFTRRCISCVNVQKATEKVLAENYGKEIENGTIVYREINLSEPESREIAQKLGVGGQSLLLASGNRKYDLTMQGFMFASRDYNQFKTTIDEAIKRLKS